MLVTRRMIAVFAALALVLCAWMAPLDAPAMRQIDAGLKRALVSFAAARVLNAVISVAQGTQASVQPLGLGVTLAPGQLLDPINDLVEQFSHLMLAASVAFGMQKALVSMGGDWPVSLALTLAVLGWMVFLLRQARVPAWLSRLLVVLLMLRFAIPVAALGSDALWRKFLASDYQTSQQLIDAASGQVDRLSPSAALTVQDQGLLDQVKSWLARNADVKQHFETLKHTAEQATEHIIRLIVIFLLQTLVMPLLLLWAMYGVVRRVFELSWQGPQA